MEVLESHLDTSSSEYKERHAHHAGLARELRERLAQVKERPAKLLDKHTQRGKLYVRDRVERLLDPATPFLELSALAAWGLYDDAAPSAGVVTGVGSVAGREVMKSVVA